MSKTIPLLDKDSLLFPSTGTALLNPNGLLAFGGDLSIKRLYHAYSQGIFPWYSEGEPVMWWSPSPRAIIPTHSIKINRTLRKVLKQQNFTVTVNKAFKSVISLCAQAPFRKEGTWIMPEMIDAYIQLHKHGLAHSIEIWMDEELAGGLYGVAIKGYFSGESMFYKQSNASKIALVYLSKLLQSQGTSFIDCQMQNSFLQDMGCIEISRLTFEEMKNNALDRVVNGDIWQPQTLNLAGILTNV